MSVRVQIIFDTDESHIDALTKYAEEMATAFGTFTFDTVDKGLQEVCVTDFSMLIEGRDVG
jgi:hypothetical protein